MLLPLLLPTPQCGGEDFQSIVLLLHMAQNLGFQPQAQTHDKITEGRGFGCSSGTFELEQHKNLICIGGSGRTGRRLFKQLLHVFSEYAAHYPNQARLGNSKNKQAIEVQAGCA